MIVIFATKNPQQHTEGTEKNERTLFHDFEFKSFHSFIHHSLFIDVSLKKFSFKEKTEKMSKRGRIKYSGAFSRFRGKTHLKLG